MQITRPSHVVLSAERRVSATSSTHRRRPTAEPAVAEQHPRSGADLPQQLIRRSSLNRRGAKQYGCILPKALPPIPPSILLTERPPTLLLGFLLHLHLRRILRAPPQIPSFSNLSITSPSTDNRPLTTSKLSSSTLQPTTVETRFKNLRGRDFDVPWWS